MNSHSHPSLITSVAGFAFLASMVLGCPQSSAAEVRLKLGQTRTIAVPQAGGPSVEVRLQFSYLDSTVVILEVNHSGKTMLTYDAKMCFKGTDRCVATTTVAVMPKLQSTEMWYDPIDRLILSNFRFEQ